MLFHVDGTTDGEVAQKTVGPSKCDVNTLTVHLLGSHVFFCFFFCYLFCYIKEDSQAILLFCLVWFVFASIRDMLPIWVIWFWYGVTVRATFPPVNYFIVLFFGVYRWWFFCRIIFPPVYINVKGSSFRHINWGCSSTLADTPLEKLERKYSELSNFHKI